MKTILAQEDIRKLGKIVVHSYEVTNSLIDDVPQLAASRENAYGYVRNWVMDYMFMNSDFNHNKLKNKVKNHDHLLVDISSNIHLTINHVSSSAEHSRFALFRYDYSIENSLFGDELFESGTINGNDIYGELLHIGKTYAESAIVAFPNTKFESIEIPLYTQEKVKEEIVEKATIYIKRKVSNG